MAADRPTFYGGEAVFDGVMMRGRTAWSLAVRMPSGEISVEVQPLSAWMMTAKRLLLLRGVIALATSVVLGSRSLVGSMRLRDAAASKASPVEGFLVAVGVLLVLAAFLFLPVLVATQIPVVSANSWAFSTVESIIRLGMVFGYIGLLGRVAEVREVYRYHGAEHQAIAARESDAQLIPSELLKFSPAHPRCGTSFLLLVVLVGIVLHAFAGMHPTATMALTRVVLLPLVLGCTYELIRVASSHLDSRWGSLVIAPGLALQRLTTRQPELRHLEVAIAALQAVEAADERAASGSTFQSAVDDVEPRQIKSAIATNRA